MAGGTAQATFVECKVRRDCYERDRKVPLAKPTGTFKTLVGHYVPPPDTWWMGNMVRSVMWRFTGERRSWWQYSETYFLYHHATGVVRDDGYVLSGPTTTILHHTVNNMDPHPVYGCARVIDGYLVGTTLDGIRYGHE